MIVVDASAVLAILLDEPDRAALSIALARQGSGMMSPVNYWEVLVKMIALGGEEGRANVEKFLARTNIQIANISASDAQAAADAFERWGKRSPAKLNLGDCFAYALAKSEGDGLLYKGNDFSQTDIPSALA